MRARAEALGLSIDLYQPFRDFEAVPAAQLQRNLRRAEAKFDVMEQLGVDTILVCSNVSPDAIDDDDLAAEQLHALAARADERGLKIAYEALAWGRHVSEYDHAWRIVEAADHPALGTCLDSFHILSRGTDLAAIDTIPGDRIFFLQLADAPHLTMDVLQWSRHYRCFPGQGALDVAGLVDARARRRLRRPAVARGLQRRLPPGRPGPHRDRRDALAARARGSSCRRPRRSTASRSSSSASTPAPPPRPRPCCGRWASVTPARIAASRCSCGSTATSASCSTTAPATTTRRSSRSPSPAAIRTPAPRARRRCSRRCSSAAAVAGEADLAAVAAPDGTSVFFCGDGLARRLPGHRRAERRRAVPIDRIDHITLAQPFEAFDEAGLFYRSVLDLQPSESQELAAPDGLVRSRAVASRDGRVRVVLNVPALAGTRAGRAAARRVRLRATRSPPRARCASAASRCWPSRTTTTTTWRRGWSSTRRCWTSCASSACSTTAAREGELLHFYTALIGGRVFFEVLERRGGYGGYGARNSPVRMAAQRAVATPVT